eukprot:5270520-Prymnesium_polylepis.2
MEMSHVLQSILLSLYKNIQLDQLPLPGALRLRRIRYPHVLLRELALQHRATPLKGDRCQLCASSSTLTRPRKSSTS